MSRKHIDKSKAESKRGSDTAEQLSLGKIIDTLTPSQAWTLLGIIFMVVSGAFGLGYKLKSSIAQSEIADVQVQVTTLKTELNELRVKSEALLVTNKELGTKERFLTFYIRYLDAKGSSERSPFDQNIMTKRREAAEILVTFLKEQLSTLPAKGAPGDGIPTMRVGMGRTAKESVIIFNDGTRWDLPSEIAASFGLRCWLCR